MFADELDIHLVPKVGAQWVPQESRYEVMTPGKNETHYLAGALDASTGELDYTLGDRKNNELFRDLLNVLDQTYPTSRIDRIYVGSTTTVFVRPKRLISGWRSIPDWSGCGCRHIVLRQSD